MVGGTLSFIVPPWAVILVQPFFSPVCGKGKRERRQEGKGRVVSRAREQRQGGEVGGCTDLTQREHGAFNTDLLHTLDSR